MTLESDQYTDTYAAGGEEQRGIVPATPSGSPRNGGVVEPKQGERLWIDHPLGRALILSENSHRVVCNLCRYLACAARCPSNTDAGQDHTVTSKHTGSE